MDEATETVYVVQHQGSAGRWADSPGAAFATKEEAMQQLDHYKAVLLEPLPSFGTFRVVERTERILAQS